MPELASHGAVAAEAPGGDAARPADRRGQLLAAATSRVRRVPGAVWAITACYLALLMCYSLLYPTYLGFDEPMHVDMTIALRHDPLSWPDPGERALSTAIARTQGIVYSRGRPRLTEQYLPSEIPPRSERRTIQQLGDNAPVATPPALPNQMVQHPPLYYAVGAVVLGVLPYSESLAYDQVVSILRWLSVLMIAPLPLLIWAATRRLTDDGGIAIAASALPLAVPGLARGAGNYQNDNLLILSVAILTVLLARVMTGDFTRRTAVLVGVVTSIALLTKGTALPLTPLVPLAYAAGWWRRRGGFPVASAVTACAVGAVGGLWWVRNLIVHKTVQINGFGEHMVRYDELTGAKPGPHDADIWLERFATAPPPKGSWYEIRFWSGLGLLDQNGLPFPLIRTLTILTVIGVLLAIGLGFGRGRGDRAAAGVLALPFFLITAVVAYGAFAEFRRSGVSGGIQGRYAYPAIPGLCALVAIGYGRLAGRARQLFPAIAFVGALLVQLVALRRIISGYWTPRNEPSRIDRYRGAFEAVAAWSPWPTGVTYTAFVVAALLLALAFVAVVLPGPVALLRERRRRGPDAAVAA